MGISMTEDWRKRGAETKRRVVAKEYTRSGRDEAKGIGLGRWRVMAVGKGQTALRIQHVRILVNMQKQCYAPANITLSLSSLVVQP